MSKRIYEDNPYASCWEAEITEVREMQGKLSVALSETAFYPGGGGQPADRGSIGECRVLEVYEEDNTIFHVLPSLPRSPVVECNIDFARRFDHMQQHSGQHLLSCVFNNLYRGDTLGFHLGEDYVTIDVALDEVAESMLRAVEDTVNENIYKNIEIKRHLLAQGETAGMPLRKLPPQSGRIKVVEIDGIDYSPCCGTHVGRTGEIGMVSILKAEKYKGMTRVYFICGRRCLADYRGKSNIVASLSRQLSAGEEDIPGQVEKIAGEVRRLSKKVRELQEEVCRHEAARLVKHGTGHLFASYGDKGLDDLQLIARHVLQSVEGPVILASIPDKKILFCHNGKLEMNCGSIFKEQLKRYNGRGGGSQRQAQAVFDSVEDLLGFGEMLAGSARKTP